MPLPTNLGNLVTRVTTEFKSVRAVLGALSSLSTTDKSTLVAAINEVNAKTANAGAAIDDSTARTTTVYSSSKTNSQIQAAITAIINGAPTTYDTFKEIADYIASDTTGAAAMTTAIQNRIRFDAAMTGLTTDNITQGLANLVLFGVAKQSDLSALSTAVGNTETDYVAQFNAQIV